ncbi:MAG TPA: response regulator transcription factor [Kiritimatiellia bacterium]|jgi:two-component system phosphate regulon response regulator PhoB|nr:MAG: Transcriptional regulatory protein BaeR [Verrucomicrobia bacterium ADurb.Bin018]HOU58629.1 response regulator transcription factor [Kiritimatiellia bacterium]HQK44820.1 response regulator transcription factor [Kiritimatiellia bacterium]HXK80082.1 response regulator transcription factor [Kiritimatiellia bacterium]
MTKENILIVEDEPDIQELLKFHLEKHEYAPVVAGTGEEALAILKSRSIVLVLLDLMLPGMDGLAVCSKMKQHRKLRAIPIIMLTAKNSEKDIITGLEIGADDYVTKPFNPSVLMARVQAILRRPGIAKPDADETPPIKYGPLVIDPGRHQVTVKGREVHLTYTEFRILQLLAQNPGKVFSRSQIVEYVRGEAQTVTERIVDVQMVSLRKKLNLRDDLIETVRGVGYRGKEV